MSVQSGLEATVASTFDVLSWEIELAGARCIFLDTLVGELLPTVPPEKRDRLIQGMHAVDLLAQHLTSLSAFARRMSEDASQNNHLPVGAGLAEITLGDLVNRMQVALGGEDRSATERAEAGALDLF